MADPLVDVSEGKYRVGEVWGYHTRPGEKGSFLTVLKVESSPTIGVIVHIRVDGLRIENPQAESGMSDSIGHMPVLEQAIDGSVTSRLTAVVPSFRRDQDDGYQEWRRGFDAGEAGVWSIPVADAVDHIAQALGSQGSDQAS